MIASGMNIPKKGDAILVTVGGEKEKIVNIVKRIANNGYKIYATEHTSEALRINGINSEVIYKIGEDRKPNILDFLVNREFKLVINKPDPEKAEARIRSEGYLIRRKAVEYGVPVITNLELANTLANALENYSKFGGLQNLYQYV